MSDYQNFMQKKMNLNYKTFGQGEPLLILHGMFGTLDNWQTVGKQLAEHFTVYLLDQRNHGRSPHHDEMNYAALSEDLRYFMESHWIFKAHIMGHSMGGKTAMQFALDHPDMTDKLIIVDIAPKRYAGGHESILNAIMALDLSQLTQRQDAENFLTAQLPQEPPSTVQFLMKNLSRNKDGAFEWKMNFRAIYNHYQEILENVKPTYHAHFEGDTLFLRGSRSSYILDEDQAAIASLFPQARLETIAHAGHWVHADQPEQLLQAVRQFLKD